MRERCKRCGAFEACPHEAERKLGVDLRTAIPRRTPVQTPKARKLPAAPARKPDRKA